jgi:hypothetical protein
VSPPRQRNAGTAPGGFGEATTNNVKPIPLRQDDQAARRYSVVVDKRPDCRIVFQTRLDKVDADLIVLRLASIGCRAMVVPMMMIDAPGMQRRR